VDNTQAQSGKNPYVIDSTMETFANDVIETSMTVPVLVDFWAPWCGPCKQLTPLLEKLVAAAAGAVRLVKVNIDDNPELASQLRIQSVPTVYAFKEGRGIDAFQGVIPESQIKAFIEKLVGEIGPTPAEALIEEATILLEAGDNTEAAERFTAALQTEPENLPALVGLSKCYIAAGDLDEAENLLAQVPPNQANDPDVASARANLELSKGAGQAAADLGPLLERVEKNPKDLAARFELAEAQLAASQNEDAVDTLLESIRIDRNWDGEAARKKLVTLFEAFGPTDELTLSARRRLSSLLFS
jgi:putative thioredoxin